MFPNLSFAELLKSLGNQPKDKLHRQQELSTRVEKQPRTDLSFQDLTPEDLKNFFEATRYERLGTLNLRGNHIDVSGVEEIVKGMQLNTTVLVLDLRDNNVDDEALLLLKDLFVPGRWLKNLDVRGNRLSASAFSSFSLLVTELNQTPPPTMIQLESGATQPRPFRSEQLGARCLIFSITRPRAGASTQSLRAACDRPQESKAKAKL